VPELYRPLADKVAAIQKDSIHEQLTIGALPRAGAKTQVTDLQHDYLQLRTRFMKQLIEELPDKLIKSL
jgi:hypothetical protein